MRICGVIKKDGIPCHRRTNIGYCWQHNGNQRGGNENCPEDKKLRRRV